MAPRKDGRTLSSTASRLPPAGASFPARSSSCRRRCRPRCRRRRGRQCHPACTPSICSCTRSSSGPPAKTRFVHLQTCMQPCANHRSRRRKPDRCLMPVQRWRSAPYFGPCIGRPSLEEVPARRIPHTRVCSTIPAFPESITLSNSRHRLCSRSPLEHRRTRNQTLTHWRPLVPELRRSRRRKRGERAAAAAAAVVAVAKSGM
mmetsp:Transcript_41749/g.89634  ORF Transcript_41749/g.89634 Transcript_41749/m.89634 type:complete len:203 (+) Transcript_41749:778-1386(+)